MQGTLSFLFNEFDGSKPFSAVVADAVAAGFTEPDPREDLSGMDVARKVVILAREIGMNLELDDVELESLVPAALQSWSPPDASLGIAEQFVEQLKQYDAQMAAKAAEASARDHVLRYVGVVDQKAGKVSVKLQSYPRSHAFAGLQWADNVIQFDTERYQPRPLIVQGPGAGAAVTAAGIFSDVLAIAGRRS